MFEEIRSVFFLSSSAEPAQVNATAHNAVGGPFDAFDPLYA